MSPIHQHEFPNGLTLLAEPMPGVASAAMTMLLPAGAITETDGKVGSATVLAEMMLRGAGELDAKQHSDELDRLGVHRSTDVQSTYLRLGATFMGDRISAVLPLLMDTVRRPRLEDAAFEPSRQLALQAIEALDDDPQDKVMIQLKQQHLGLPLGRSVMGETEDLKNLRVEDVRAHLAERFTPRNTVLAFAGAVDFEELRDRVAELIDDWTGQCDMPTASPSGQGGYRNIEAQTAQQHIGAAYNALPEPDAESMTQRLAIAVLSGGTSSRLFTEVRENRGLCYSVYATYVAQKTFGVIYAYAGTTTDRAAETLQVMTDEINKLNSGVSEDEFRRAVVGLKSRLVMQGESTGARASAIATDVTLRDEPRTLDDIARQIDAVSFDGLNRFLSESLMPELTTLTIGPEAIQSTV